jgi:hypothetical protein
MPPIDVNVAPIRIALTYQSPGGGAARRLHVVLGVHLEPAISDCAHNLGIVLWL